MVKLWWNYGEIMVELWGIVSGCFPNKYIELLVLMGFHFYFYFLNLFLIL